MSKPDGGPAFPTTWDSSDTRLQTEGGMSLRQYYAGEVVKGVWSNSALITALLRANPTRSGLEQSIACDAVTQADALLAELNKETTKD